MQHTLTLFLIMLAVGVVAASGGAFLIITTIFLTAALFNLQDTSAQYQDKTHADISRLEQALFAQTADLLSLRSMTETQVQLLETLRANAELTKNEMHQRFLCLDQKLKLATTPHATSPPATPPLSPAAPHSSSTTEPASTDNAVAADATHGLINQVASVATATSSTLPSPTVKPTTPLTSKSTPVCRTPTASARTPSPPSKSTTSTYIQAPSGSPSVKPIPHSNKSTPIHRTPAFSTVTPSPLSKSTTTARTTPSSQAPTGVSLAAEALMDLFASGPSRPTPSVEPSSAKSSPVSRTPLASRSPSTKLTSPCPVKPSLHSAKSSPNPVNACTSSVNLNRTGQTPAASASKLSAVPSTATPPAGKSSRTTPRNVTRAVEATDLISLASAASVASPLPSTSVATPANPPAAVPSPKSADASHAVEAGPISQHASAAESPRSVPLPLPDKKEEDFFAAQTPPAMTRKKVASNAAPASPAVPVQAVKQVVRVPGATPPKSQQPTLHLPKLEPKRRTVAQRTAPLKHPQQKVEPAQPKRELKEPKSAQVETLLKDLVHIRKSLNRSSNPAKTFRELDEGLSRMRLSIRKVEADYLALKQTGFVHSVDIPELIPRVVKALKVESFLER
ncbi:hypothetical protein HDU81_010710 [Chytriomyces hyalinus]|nr:hypothetical protein HDU81_010710 [Chytriomyces hyalinus]